MDNGDVLFLDAGRSRMKLWQERAGALHVDETL